MRPLPLTRGGAGLARIPPKCCHLAHDSGSSNLMRSNRLVLLVGVFLAVIAYVGIALLLNGGQTPQPGPNAVQTVLPAVIAVKDIPLGASVTEDMLTTQDLK